MNAQDLFKASGLTRYSFQGKTDEDDEKIYNLINSLKTSGFKIIKDPEGNEYQHKAIKGHETVVYNLRFGNSGRPAIWIPKYKNENKVMKTKTQMLEDKLRPLVRSIVAQEKKKTVLKEQIDDNVKSNILVSLKQHNKDLTRISEVLEKFGEHVLHQKIETSIKWINDVYTALKNYK